MLVGSLLTVMSVGIDLASPWPLKAVVDGVLAPAGRGAPRSDVEFRLIVAVVAMLGLVFAGAAVSYWSSRLLSAAGLNIASDIRMRVMAHLQRQSLRYHGEHRVGDLVARVTSDVDRTQDMIVQTLATLFPNALLVSGMFGVMIVLDPMFALLAVASALPLIWSTHRSRRQLRVAARQTRRADGELASAATENLSAVHLVQAFTLERNRLERFAGLSAASLRAGLEANRLQARFGPMVDVCGVLSAALVLWLGAHRVLDGQLSLGALLVFLSYLGSLFKPIKALSKLSSVVSKGTAAAERVTSLLDTAPEIADRPGSRPSAVRGAISFEDVSFSYGREPVLSNLSLHIAPGETVALVGPTGAGKSTVAAMIPRLIDADSGRVSVDWLDVRDHRLASLRGQIGMVLQDSVLLEGTLRDNILCGRRDATDFDVRRAVRLSLVEEFVGRLPAGLDTRIGERGTNLSGGQRQRVAIARAILRDSSIVILDEPTSALDAASEELLVAALANLPRDRTTIVIAHRLSTVRNADRILVLDGGRLVEQGSHEHLKSAGGLYQRLVSFQAGTAALSAEVAPRHAQPLPPPGGVVLRSG